MAANNKMVGLDRGVRILIATSDGEKIPNPRFGDSDLRVRFHQKAVSSCTRFAPNGKVANARDRERQKAILRLARAKERQRNARRDYLHKKARLLIKTYSVLAIERLNVRLMTKSARGSVELPGKGVRAKSGLNRVLLDASFTLLRSMIMAKAEEAGRRIIEVEARHTSQTCAACRKRDARSRTAERFLCVHCGNCDDADVNAAKVILLRAQSALKSEPNAGEEPASVAKATLRSARRGHGRGRQKKNADQAAGVTNGGR